MSARWRILAGLLGLALLAGCGAEEDRAWLGYVEGDYLRLGAREAGMVTSLAVREGEAVEAGAALFAVDAARARLAVDQAQAQLQAAEARVQDLMRGGRPEEIEAAQQQLAQARADLNLAQTDFTRSQELVEDGAAPRARLDEHRRALETARSRVAELESRLALVRQPARQDQIDAAQREAEAARAALDQARELLAERSVAAPKAGLVDRVYLREGEFAAPGAPVLSLLPPDNVKIVFFAPETELARLSPGTRVALACDSCPAGLTAAVSRVGAQAEFAPPVIYSQDARAKLVYRIEARTGGDAALKPGQPVEVRPAGAAP